MRRRLPGIAMIVARFVHISLPLCFTGRAFSIECVWSHCNQFHLADLVLFFETAHKTHPPTIHKMKCKRTKMCYVKTIICLRNSKHILRKCRWTLCKQQHQQKKRPNEQKNTSAEIKCCHWVWLVEEFVRGFLDFLVVHCSSGNNRNGGLQNRIWIFPLSMRCSRNLFFRSVTMRTMA